MHQEEKQEKYYKQHDQSMDSMIIGNLHTMAVPESSSASEKAVSSSEGNAWANEKSPGSRSELSGQECNLRNTENVREFLESKESQELEKILSMRLSRNFDENLVGQNGQLMTQHNDSLRHIVNEVSITVHQGTQNSLMQSQFGGLINPIRCESGEEPEIGVNNHTLSNVEEVGMEESCQSTQVQQIQTSAKQNSISPSTNHIQSLEDFLQLQCELRVNKNLYCPPEDNQKIEFPKYVSPKFHKTLLKKKLEIQIPESSTQTQYQESTAQTSPSLFEQKNHNDDPQFSEQDLIQSIAKSFVDSQYSTFKERVSGLCDKLSTSELKLEYEFKRSEQLEQEIWSEQWKTNIAKTIAVIALFITVIVQFKILFLKAQQSEDSCHASRI